MSSWSTTSISRRALSSALVLLALAATPRIAAAQFQVSQSDVLLKSNVTAKRSTVLRITNPADEVADATIEVQDWHRDDNGTPAFLPLGSSTGSCREHLKITPSSLRIAPHETEHVRVAFNGEYDKSCWAIVFVQPTEQPAASHGPARALRPAQPGVKVYVQPEWARREGSVESLTYMPAQGVLEVIFRNTGDAHLETYGAIEIRNPKNLVLATIDIERFPVVPTDQRRIRLAVPKLPLGQYTAVALFDYAGADIAERELQFEIR